MTTPSTNAGSLARQRNGVLQRVGRWISDMKVRKRLRRERAELARLPQHLLRDMGLEHCAPDPTPDVIMFWR
jgi:uncharacterized protein YjiS (DUF1127 family)